MNIAMISYHACPLAYQEGKETGGMQVYVLELAKALVKMGNQVDIYTRIQDTISPEIVDFLPGMRVIHLPAGPRHSLDKTLLIKHIPVFTRNLQHYIRNNKLAYDLIHAHYYQSGLIAMQIRSKYGNRAPLVTSFHTLGLIKNMVARTPAETAAPERVTIEFDLVKKSTAIVAASELDREYLFHLYNCPPEKINVVNPGVDTTIFKPIPKEEALDYIASVTREKTILFVGRIEPLKGIDVLMHSLKILQTKKPALDVCLLIVGGRPAKDKPEELQRLKNLEKTLGISPIVGYVTQRHQHELPYYYNSADVVVLPSYYESFGMTALEAMACEVPVIITNTTGVSSLFGHELSQLIVSANNPLELATQIENVINNQRFRQEYRHKVRKLIRHFTWEETARKTIAVYKRISLHE